MNFKRKLALITIFSGMALNLISGGGDSFFKKADDTINSAWDTAYNNPKYSLPALALLAANSGILAYKNSKSFKSKVDNNAKKVKESFMDRIVFPTLLKWEIIKDEGISKEDATRSAALLIAAVGAKLLDNRIGVSGKTFGFSKWALGKSGEGLRYFGRFVRNNKDKVLLTGIVSYFGILSTKYLWNFYESVKADTANYVNPLDKFLMSLDQEQRDQILGSQKLFHLIGQAADDLSVLKDDAFLQILTDDQREELGQLLSA